MAEPKGGLGYIGDNPKAIEDSEAALERLSKALESRGGGMFDPQMLAMAEGFLAPTRSGSFGESLGNAANRLRLAQEAQGKQELESAQGNLAVIQQKAVIEQQKRAGEGYKALEEEYGLRPKTIPAGAPMQAPPPTSTEIGQAPAGQATAGQLPTGQAPAFNPMSALEFDFSTPMPVDKAAIIAKNKAAGITNPLLAKLDIQKAERENIVAKEGYIHDQNTGKLKLIPPKPGEEDVSTYIPAFEGYPGGNVKVSKGTKAALDYAAQTGSPAYWDIAKTAVNGPPRAPAPGAQQAPAAPTVGGPAQTGAVQTPAVTPLQAERLPPLVNGQPAAPVTPPPVSAAAPPAPAATAAPKRRLTQEEEKAAEARQAMELRLEEERRKGEQQARQKRSEIRPEALEKQSTEQEMKARQEITDNNKEANETIGFANQFRKYADLPGSQKMFGILTNDKISSGIAELVKSGIGVTGYTVGIPAIENVMRSANLTPAEQAQYRSFLQLTTQLQLQQAKYMKGPVSNYERTIVADAVIGPQDNPETIRMKADIMAARAQFDRQVARKFKESKQDAVEFLSSDEYLNNMIPRYHNLLTRLISGETRLQPRPPSQPKNPAQSSLTQRADALAGIR